MPASFGTLPNNVLQRIFHHTRGPTEKRTFKTKLGLSISLVCRSLRQYGQELVWRAPVLNYSEISSTRMSIFHDFEQLKHLHPFVKVFIMTSHRGISIPSLETKPSPSQVIEKFLKHCQDLRVLSISVPDIPESEATMIFSLAAFLPRLESAMFSSAPILLDSTTVRALSTGFPFTRILQVMIRIPPSFRPRNLDLSAPILSPLHELEIDVDGDPGGIPSLLDVFVKSFDKSTIVKVIYGPSFFSVYPFCFLESLPALRNVSIELFLEDILHGSLTSILRSLRRLSHVLTFTINGKLSRRAHLEQSELSPIPISTLLSAIPSSLYVFLIKGIHFRGPLSYPQLRIKRSLLSQTEGPTVHCYFEQSVSKQLVRLKKMRDPKGVLRWYQIIEI